MVLWAAALWLTLGAPPNANQHAAAAHFSQGLLLSANGDDVASLKEFEEAYRLAPAYQVLFNLGVVHEKLSEPLPALEAFQAYLAQGGDAVPRDKRRQVEQELVTLRKQLGEIAVTVEGEPATLELDGLEHGTTPLTARLYVLPGKHRVAAKRGDEAAHTEVEVHRGDRAAVTLTLIAPPAEQTNPTDQPAIDQAPTLTPVSIAPAPAVPVPMPAVSADVAPSKPWFARWYVWTIVGVVVVGAVTTVAVIETRPHYDVRIDTP